VNFIALDSMDVIIASLLLISNAVIFIVLRLDLAARFLFSGLRMVVQLLLVGLVLKTLFASASPLYTGLAVMVMVLFAGREAIARQERTFTGWWSYGLGTGSMMAAGILVTVFALSTQIQPDPWYAPRFAIPILGMILGNTMNGVSIGLDRLLAAVVMDKAAIEARLALGATISDALRPAIRQAVRAGLIPTVNGMAAAGLVALPGMMTGQILAGVDPTEAVKYQIIIWFLIAGGTGLGLLAAVLGTAKHLHDDRHRLRLDRIKQ